MSAPLALPVDESHPRNPRNGYGLAKCANEDYARMCSEVRGLSVAVFRLPWVMTHDPSEEWFAWADRKQKLEDDLVIAKEAYRIVQEAVNNVIKHAGTREVTIRLAWCDQPASVEVIDRGAGFLVSEQAPQRGHMGLASMAERARELGWTLTIDSQPGQGTCIKVQER